MQHDRSGRRVLPRLAATLVNKTRLTECLPTPVEPDVDPGRQLPVGPVGRRNHQPVGLNRLVQPGDEPSYHQSILPGPGGIPPGKLAGPLDPRCQQAMGFLDIAGGKELLVFKVILDRPVIDHHVGQQRTGLLVPLVPHLLDHPGQPGKTLPQCLRLLLRHLHAQAGDAADSGRVVISRAIGSKGQDRQKNNTEAEQSYHGRFSW